MAREVSRLNQVDANPSLPKLGHRWVVPVSPHLFPWLELGGLATRKEAPRRPLPGTPDPCATSPQTGSQPENHRSRRGVFEQAVLVLLRAGSGRVANHRGGGRWKRKIAEVGCSNERSRQRQLGSDLVHDRIRNQAGPGSCQTKHVGLVFVAICYREATLALDGTRRTHFQTGRGTGEHL
jgi:hypothetical protein